MTTCIQMTPAGLALAHASSAAQCLNPFLDNVCETVPVAIALQGGGSAQHSTACLAAWVLMLLLQHSMQKDTALRLSQMHGACYGSCQTWTYMQSQDPEQAAGMPARVTASASIPAPSHTKNVVNQYPSRRCVNGTNPGACTQGTSPS
jgi:hypothetical protein